MPWTTGEFRAYPLFIGRFGDSAAFPDTAIEAHLRLAGQTHGCQWSNEAIALLVAHRLEVMARTGILPTADGASLPSSPMEGLEPFIAVGSTISSLSVAKAVAPSILISPALARARVDGG